MDALTITLGTIGALISLVCWYAFIGGVVKMVKTIRLGQPDATRNGPFVPRLRQLIIEFAAHTKMVKKRTVGSAHWFVMWGFLIGSLAWLDAYGETFSGLGRGVGRGLQRVLQDPQQRQRGDPERHCDNESRGERRAQARPQLAGCNRTSGIHPLLVRAHLSGHLQARRIL